MRYLLPLFCLAAASAQSISILSGNGQLVSSHVRYEPLVVQVRGASGLPASNVTVTWQVISGNGQATLANFTTTATSVTNEDGIASMQFFQNPFPIFGTSFAQSQVSASALGAAATFTETVAFRDFASAVEQVEVYVLSEIGRYAGAAGTVHPQPFRLQVAGQLGGAVAGVSVQVVSGDATTGPAIACDSAPGQPAGTVYTDSSGHAECTLRFSGHAGVGTFRVFVGGNWRVYPAAAIPFTVTQGLSYRLAAVSGSDQTGSVGTTLPLALIAQLTDAAGKPAAGEAVIWDVPLGGGVLISTTATTDQFGRVWTSFRPSLSGPSQVRVRLAAESSVQALFSVTATAAATPSCSFTLSPTSIAAPVSGLTGSASLTASAFGCAWTAISSAPWITITSPSSGSSGATVTFSIAPNTAAARSGTITAGGASITITQAGISETGCSASLTLVALTLPPSGVSGHFGLTLSGNCTWSATSDSNWLSIMPASGSGSASLSYIAAANSGPTSRLAHVTVAGQTLTVTQLGTEISGDAARLVSHLYHSFLGRAPSPGEMASHIEALSRGTSRAEIVGSLLGSDEFFRGGRFVAHLYLGLLNRDPDYQGWLHLSQRLRSGTSSHVQLAADFLSSAEFIKRHGELSNTQWVQLLYGQVLQRAGAPSEIESWLAALASDRSRADVAVAFLLSEENRTATLPRLLAYSVYSALVQRAPSPFEASAAVWQIQGGTFGKLIEALLTGPEFRLLLR